MRTDRLSDNFLEAEFHGGRGWAAPGSRARYEALARGTLEEVRLSARERWGDVWVIVTPNGGERSKRLGNYGSSVPGSRHLPPEDRARGQQGSDAAADIKVVYAATGRYVPAADVAELVETLMAAGRIPQGGVGRYASFTHVDNRGSVARWGKR